MTDLNQYPRIYCSICESTNPLMVCPMAADEMNDHDAADLMCYKCNLVIATLHAHVEEKK